MVEKLRLYSENWLHTNIEYRTVHWRSLLRKDTNAHQTESVMGKRLAQEIKIELFTC